MTLLNTVRRPNRIHVITDGAVIDDDALMVGLISKVIFAPFLNAVIACRGHAMLSLAVAGNIAGNCAKFQSFDGLKASALGEVRSSLNCLTFVDDIGMDIVIAGWSETRGPESFLIRTFEGSDLPPWKLIDLADGILMPSNQHIFREVGDELADYSNELTDQDLIEVAELQRGHIEPHGSKRIPTSWVGGFLQVTTVTEREISTRIIHRWDDKIGRPLNSRSRKMVG
jgi:hypothetical protein